MAEVHSVQMIASEVHIHAHFLNTRGKLKITTNTENKPKTGPYDKTVSTVFLSSLLQVGDIDCPHPDDVVNHVHPPGHWHVTCHLSLRPCGWITGTASNHEALQLLDNSQWIRSSKKANFPKHNRGSFLESPFEEWHMKHRVTHDHFSVPACEVLLVALKLCVRASRNQREDLSLSIGHIKILIMTKLLVALPIKTVIDSHSKSHNLLLPRPYEDPGGISALFILHSKLTMLCHPIKDAGQNARKHPS